MSTERTPYYPDRLKLQADFVTYLGGLAQLPTTDAAEKALVASANSISSSDVPYADKIADDVLLMLNGKIKNPKQAQSIALRGIQSYAYSGLSVRADVVNAVTQSARIKKSKLRNHLTPITANFYDMGLNDAPRRARKVYKQYGHAALRTLGLDAWPSRLVRNFRDRA